MDKNSDSLPDENSGEASENGAQPDSAGDELIGGGGADSAEDAIAAAKDAAAGLASGGRAKLGAITTNFGAGGSTSASLKAGSPENSRAASGPAGGSSGRAKDQIRQGGRRSTARPANARGSMNQLKFASAQSRRGLGAQNRAGAFQAATDAFEGQTAPGESGTPIGGSGAGMDGGSIGAAPNTGSAGPVNQKDVTNKTCPAGTFMTQGECQYIPPQNVTPWQNIVQKALGYFIAAAVLVTLGLTLLLKAPPGPWQILGGVLIAAGVSVGILGFVLGNQIEDEYGQSLQRDAIFDEGGRAIRGETPNTTGRSNLKGVENLYQKHDFGFNK
jgi:hypothetical protein